MHSHHNKESKSSLSNSKLPPAQTMDRQWQIEINKDKFSKLLLSDFNKITKVMDKIRLAVQSNLGLSELARKQFEESQPLWVKKGKPIFPINSSGVIEKHKIFHDSSKSKQNNSAKVQYISDDLQEKGLSILFKTKFRSFSLYINEEGQVNSSLELHWQAIYDDLLPDNEKNKSQVHKSFTPWQRYAEANFFNGRSVNKILTYLSQDLHEIFQYNTKSYYQESPSENISINKNNIKLIDTSTANLYLTLDSSIIAPDKDLDVKTNMPMLAIVKCKTNLMGPIIKIVPALYRKKKVSIVLSGHQTETEIQKVISCDFKKQTLHHWKLKHGIIIKNSCATTSKPPIWSSLNLLKFDHLVKHTSSAPMVRGSDAASRKLWISGYNIPTVYSEMITISDIFNMSYSNHRTPKEILEKFYYKHQSTSSFKRLSITEYELNKVQNFAFQVAVPHKTQYAEFFWGKDGENIARTTIIAVKLLHEMVPPEFHNKIRFAVNMCCPAASIEKMGAGFGLRAKPEYIKKIVAAIKTKFPDLDIEFKTLMLSNADKCISRKERIITLESKTACHNKNHHNISAEKNIKVAEFMSQAGADRLIWQGKARNKEEYKFHTVTKITQNSRVKKSFKFGFSGMVVTLRESNMIKLGFSEKESPHYSVEKILQLSFQDNYEVMLGRVLLGSSWLLLGRHACDREIVLMSLLHSYLIKDFNTGEGIFGVDLMQIHVLYNLRHLKDINLRNKIMAQTIKAKSADEIISNLNQIFRYLQTSHRRNPDSLLSPSLFRIKSAVDKATASEIQFYCEREQNLINNQTAKARLMKLSR